jgi:hypothetical protein
MSRMSLDEDHREALERAFFLKSEGIGWDEIIPMLRKEGILESPGEAYDPLTLDSWYDTPDEHTQDSRNAAEGDLDEDLVPEGHEDDTEDSLIVSLNTLELLSLSSEISSAEVEVPAEDDGKHDPMALLAIMVRDMESRLTTSIDQRIRAALYSVSSDQTRDPSCFPPHPPKHGKAGKKYAGEKRDLRVRIDRNLFTLLRNEAKNHHGGNMSQCLDAVLWRYFDQPDLSFQQSASKRED